MARRLPPLNALRMFEVAARLTSFTQAAQELHVTNAAVSHQIKQLEEFLGLQLFERRNNQLSLTMAGESYLPRVREAFRALQQATDALLDDKTTTLRVAVPPALGTKWLVPRLYRFLNLHPDVRVEVSSDFDRDYQRNDITIDHRQVDAPDLVVERFTSSTVFPVCNPATATTIRNTQDLARQTLLHERSQQRQSHLPNWQQWLEESGAAQIDASHGPAFSDAQMTLQAAIDGQGIALGQQILVEYDIAAGRLVRPLAKEVSLRVPYYLIFPQHAAQSHAFAVFRQWLMDEAKRSG
ncbi:transcriptional regulator GcvA [Amantichitinum ursilacus]|uniref:Glycine cleavage system transcriptional activator n=1 Tax=Amantichitinum ursilacus TaxID=857265 RepID=A0A0N1JRP3_9NEIS|nr:transcriptional regulator GcvA [Amantichitinum ursilacus]KPC49804.1 Glycine cleavage system transcriptional activator [Amantichitinum ursilacus]